MHNYINKKEKTTSNIFEFINNNSNKGCYGIGILDSFTGSHKTSSIIKFLSDYINNYESEFKTVYYITPRLSNLKDTYEELLESIEDKESILKIDSNMETLSNLNKEDYFLLQSIFNSISFNSDSFVSKKIKSIKNNIIDEIKKLRSLKSKNLAEHYRYALSSDHIRSVYSNLQNIFSDISYTKFCSFLDSEQLYFFEKIFFPSMLIRKKKVKIVFASTQKVLSGFIEPKGLFLPFQYEFDSLFFLDESDSQYSEMIAFLSKKQQYNLYDHLKNIIQAVSMTPGIKQSCYYNCGNKSFNEIFQEFKHTIFDKFKNKYNPYLNIDYHRREFENFEDIHFLLDVNNKLYSQNKKEYKYQTNLEEFNNYITSEGDGLSLQLFIEEAHQFIDHDFSLFFYKMFRSFFVNYKKDNEEDKILFNNLFTSLLKDLNLYNEQDMYHASSLYNRLKENIQALTLSEEQSDSDIYNKSFKYTSIHRKGEESSALINSIYIPYSPNYILKKLATKNKVFLCSATADNKSVVHNFDYLYLKNEMKSEQLKFSRLPYESLVSLENIKNKYKNSYNSFNVKSINKCEDHRKYLQNWFEENNFNEREQKLLINSQFETDIYYNRFYSLLNGLLNFINSNQRYGIFFLPKLYQNEEGIKLLNKFINKTTSNPISLFSVNASDIKSGVFEDEIWPIFSEKENGRCIIFTHYNTMSSGINLQRPEYNTWKKFDIDFMYFELPTDLLISSFAKNNKNHQSLVTSIFHLQSLFYNNEINEHDYNIALGSLMKNFNQGSLLYLNKLYKKTNDYKLALWKILEQAIGRMSRTINKHDRSQIALSSLLYEQLTNIKFVGDENSVSGYEVSLLKDFILEKNN
jgi:hypothetical protein